MRFKLGKKIARPEAVKLKFGAYFKADLLPTVPAVFGRPWLITQWGMLANDTVGDCVWASADHRTMLLCAEAGSKVPVFTPTTATADYSAATGYTPTDPSTDQGTDMTAAAAYQQKIGVLDINGDRHKTNIYTALNVSNLDELARAVYLFGAVDIGVQLPETAQDQYNEAVPWDVTSSSTEGGHCIPIVGRNSAGNWLCVTWGRLQAITPAFITAYMDEGIVSLSLERLNAKGLSPESYNQAQLLDDFKQVTA